MTTTIQYDHQISAAADLPLADADPRLAIPAEERILIVRAAYNGHPTDAARPVQRIELYLTQFPVTKPVTHTTVQLVYRLGRISQDEAERIMRQLAASGLLPAAFEPEAEHGMTLARVTDPTAVDLMSQHYPGHQPYPANPDPGTVGEMLHRYATPTTSTPAQPSVTLPVIRRQDRQWNLGPNTGAISQAWRVQVVDRATEYATPDGRYLDVQHVQDWRNEVAGQVDAWMAEPWPPPYQPAPRRQPQAEITSPELAAAHAAAEARYGR